jgi:hypothetical protein
MNFREFQFGTTVFLFMIPPHLLILFLFIAQVGNNPMKLGTFISINCALGLIYVLFYGMTTTVDSKRISISYGVGLIRKSFSVKNIESVSVVSNPWYYGWGIRLIPNGWLYNISGYAGIEITFRDRKSVIRIGSAAANNLKRAIQDAIKVSTE